MSLGPGDTDHMLISHAEVFYMRLVQYRIFLKSLINNKLLISILYRRLQ